MRGARPNESQASVMRQRSAGVLAVVRLWTQLIQHLIAKSWTMERKLRFSFSYLVVSLRISFTLQKNRSTRFRFA